MNDNIQKQAHLDEEDSEKSKGIEISDNFGQLLKHFRKIRNYSLKELEEISGVSSSYIFRIESGQRKSVSIIKIIQLCEALEVSYHDVLKTAYNEVGTDRKSANSLQELMISNDFMLDGQPASRRAKEILAKLNEYVINSSWTEQTKVRELYLLSELIDQFKVAL